MSAPACAWESAARASSGRVASLSTVSSGASESSPQWPWSVYSQRHTSVVTVASGNRDLIISVHRCTASFGFHELRPSGCLASGNPNNKKRDMPRSKAVSTSRSAMSTDIRLMPGMAWIGCTTFAPLTTNMGYTKHDASSSVSAFANLSSRVRRRGRRRRKPGGSADFTMG